MVLPDLKRQPQRLPMRFGIIYYGTEAKNRGLDQLSQSLIAIGHKPYIVTRKPKSGEAISDFNGVPVIQIPAKRKHFHTLLSTPLPFNLIWKAGIISLAEKYKWDGIFIRETPLSWLGIKAGRVLGIPVFLDIRENLGAAYESNKTKKSVLKRIRKRCFVRSYEKFVLPKFDHIFSTTKELGKWIEDDYEISSEKLSVLGNYPSKVFLRQAERAFTNRERTKKDNVLRLVHAGYVLENRGLQDVIFVLSILREKGYNFVFRIIGEGPYLNELMRLAQETGTEANIEFIPMLPPDDVAGALAECDIGVCSYLLNEQTHQTLPGKLFEYMAVGLPVISSARKPVVRILEEVRCGLIYRSRKPEEIVKVLLNLFNDKEKRFNMGSRGREAILERYNWEVNLNILDTILNKYERNKMFF